MNAEQIAQLETKFGVRFPREYREALLAYPFSRDSEELTADATALTDSNRGCRAESPWGFAWEHHFWWVGDDGSGGFYFIDCHDELCRVYYLDHEDPADSIADQTRLKPSSLSEFMHELEQSEAEFAQDRRELLKRIASRRWWQFWIPRSPPLWAEDTPDPT